MLPVGIPGELCVGGDGIARGYLNRPELTAERFVEYSPQRIITNNPSAFSAVKIYKTGDLASWLPDGNIRFLGRIDRQVKIRGMRIETLEISQVLNHHQSVRNSVVYHR